MPKIPRTPHIFLRNLKHKLTKIKIHDKISEYDKKKDKQKSR
jgi:hypothetical protein